MSKDKSYKEILESLELKFSEKQKEEAKHKEDKEEEKEEDKEKKKELKEKKFKEKLGKHFGECFSEHTKDIHSKMCNFEEQIKSHGEAIGKLVQMSEKLLKGDK